MEFLASLADEGLTQNNPARTNRADAFDLFTSGKAGMVVAFSPLAARLDEETDVAYEVAPFPSNDGTESKTFGVTDYLMAFKKDGNANLEAVKAFYELYHQPDQVNTFIEGEGFLPVTESGLEHFAGDESLKVYLDTLPNARLTPTDDPTRDRIKLAAQQNLGSPLATRARRPPSTSCRRAPSRPADRDHPHQRPARSHSPGCGRGSPATTRPG